MKSTRYYLTVSKLYLAQWHYIKLGQMPMMQASLQDVFHVSVQPNALMFQSLCSHFSWNDGRMQSIKAKCWKFSTSFYETVTTRSDSHSSKMIKVTDGDANLIGRWCVVQYDRKPYPGTIQDVDHDSVRLRPCTVLEKNVISGRFLRMLYGTNLTVLFL